MRIESTPYFMNRWCLPLFWTATLDTIVSLLIICYAGWHRLREVVIQMLPNVQRRHIKKERRWKRRLLSLDSWMLRNSMRKCDLSWCCILIIRYSILMVHQQFPIFMACVSDKTLQFTRILINPYAYSSAAMSTERGSKKRKTRSSCSGIELAQRSTSFRSLGRRSLKMSIPTTRA